MDYAFVKSVSRSRVKGVYKEVNAIFDGTADNALRQRYAAVAQELSLMRELYHKPVSYTHQMCIRDSRARCAAYRSRKWNGPPFRPWAAHRRPAFPS